jgi:hypothetical protein
MPEDFLRKARKQKSTAKPEPGEKIQANRNNWLTSQAGRLVNAGLAGATLLVALRAVNTKHCEPPLPDFEVKTIADSADRHFKPPADPARELAAIDSWLNDTNLPTPSLKDLLTRMALCEPMEIERRRKRISSRLGVSIPWLKDAIKSHQESAKSKQVDDAPRFDVEGSTVDEVRKKVEELLDESPDEVHKKLAETIIWEYLWTHAKIFNCYGIGYVLLNDGDGAPIEVSEDDQNFNRLMISLGVHPGSSNLERIGKFVTTKSYHEGVRTETRLSFYFDPQTFTAYVARDRGCIIKITKSALAEIRNGEDGVLFIFPEKWQPLLTKPLDLLGGDLMVDDYPRSNMIRRCLMPDDYLLKYFFNDVRFDVRGLRQRQIQVLLMAYLLFLMLPGATNERVLLQCLGPSGSGKTFFAIVIGLILLGKDFKSRPFPSDPKELCNQSINTFYAVFDNVTSIPRDMRDLLCQLVTGMDVVRRILYTDRAELKVPSILTPAISSIESPLPELEYTNRAITVNFEQRAERTFISEVELRNAILRNRDDIVRNLLYRMSLVLEALEAQRDYVPKVSVRLASVATFILRIARHEGWEDSAKGLLDAWAGEQTSDALIEDDVSTAIGRWMSDKDWKSGEWLSATGLHDALVDALISGRDEAVKHSVIHSLSWKNPTELGKKLGANLKVYQERFGIERKKQRNGGNYYVFEPNSAQRATAKESGAKSISRQGSFNA